LPAHDKDSLTVRVERGLAEAGAPPRLEACLTKGLGDALTERDAEVLYQDLASEPNVSESSLNSVSLLVRGVKDALKARASPCKSALVSSGAYTAAKVDSMLKRVGMHAYRWHPDFLVR
jgi:hypothetical protein